MSSFCGVLYLRSFQEINMEMPIRQLEEQIWHLEESRDIDIDLGVMHRES